MWACGSRLDDAAVTTRVQSVATGGVEGYETFQIVLELSPSAENAYSIFGYGAATSLLCHPAALYADSDLGWAQRVPTEAR